MDRRRYMAAVVGAAATLAGCGGSPDDAGETPTGTPDPTHSTVTPTEPPTETTGGTSTGTPTATPVEAAVEVAVGPDDETRFAPSTFSVAPGETVRWVWESPGHNVVPDSVPGSSEWSGTPGDDTYDSGFVYTHTFEVAGSYEYYCAPHRTRGMTGSFTVE